MKAPCPVCDSPTHFELFHPDVDLYRCRECDHCHSHPETYRNHEDYGPSYFLETHQAWFEHPHEEMYGMLLRGIREHAKDAKTLLDVGCGNGKFLDFLRPRCDYDLVGVDLVANEPREGIEFHQSDFAKFRPAAKFDVLTSIMVVEHLEDLQLHLDHMAQLLRRDGLLVCLTINERSILYLAARFLRWCGYRGPFDRLYSIHHLNHFNANSLRHWLQDRHQILEQAFHNVPMSALDIPGNNMVSRGLKALGVWLTFQLGLVTQKTYAQTIFARVKD